MNRLKRGTKEYQDIHAWISKNYGKAQKCEKEITHTATRYHWANISGEYKKDINDYKQLCPACHKKMDARDTCKRGHLLIEGNVRIYKERERICLICGKAGQLKWRNEHKDIIRLRNIKNLELKREWLRNKRKQIKENRIIG